MAWPLLRRLRLRLRERLRLRTDSCGPLWFRCRALAAAILLDAFRSVAAGHNRVAQRNAITIMTGQEQAGRFGLDFRHHFTVFAIADIILRDGPGIKHRMLKSLLAPYAQH